MDFCNKSLVKINMNEKSKKHETAYSMERK